jgi:hypothetical protein
MKHVLMFVLQIAVGILAGLEIGHILAGDPSHRPSGPAPADAAAYDRPDYIFSDTVFVTDAVSVVIDAKGHAHLHIDGHRGTVEIDNPGSATCDDMGCVTNTATKLPVYASTAHPCATYGVIPPEWGPCAWFPNAVNWEYVGQPGATVDDCTTPAPVAGGGIAQYLAVGSCGHE